MATAAPAATDEHDAALEEQDTDEATLREVHARALARFDQAVLPQLEQRALALAARRFVSIPGAQWEGDFGDAFDNAIKLEINLTIDGLEKIHRDYNENRIVPDFRPAAGKGDEVSADTLDGLHRADSHCFDAQEARDNAFNEASAGGFGAYRLTNELADPYDRDSDAQRINPGLLIADADQCVFFDPGDKSYKKRKAKYAFVITSHSRPEFEAEHDGATADWPESTLPAEQTYDWFRPDVVKVAEYYEVEDSTEKLFVLTHRLSKEEQRFWETEISTAELAELRLMGWQVSTQKRQRRRVHKYLMSGCEVLSDQGHIAGDQIPIVPVYGKRYYVDGIERFKGYVQDRMDRQRLYNTSVSRLAEMNAQSPREIPIFAAQQMRNPQIREMWERQIIDRHAYAIVDPLINPVSGEIVSAGPIGKIDPPQMPPVAAALLQLSRTDLTEDQQDGSDEVKANTSADALEVAATRVDAKSGIYLDNFRKSVQCEGEIYLSMAADVYHEAGREVETMDEEGSDGTSTLLEPYVDEKGIQRERNDFSRGRYKVIADVTEATATRRDKAVKASLNTAEVSASVGDMELAQAALLTAIANQDGEGMTDLQKYARKRGVEMGLLEPNEEEAAAMAQAAENAQPDPTASAMEAQAEALRADAAESGARAQKTLAEIPLTIAKTKTELAKAKATLNPPQPQGGQRPQSKFGKLFDSLRSTRRPGQ